MKELPDLVRLYFRVQKLRVGMDKRIQDGEHDGPLAPPMYQTALVMTQDLEAQLLKAIEQGLEDYPVWDRWLRHVKGIGPSLGGKLLGLLLPPRPGDAVGTWYKAAGLIPTLRDGEMHLPRKARGAKVEYHLGLRATVWNIAVSIIMTSGRGSSFYHSIYERSKERLEEVHAGAWPKWRIDDVARWIMMKLLLSHLWEQYCQSMGLEPVKPYVIAIMGHDGYIPCPEWDGKEKI